MARCTISVPSQQGQIPSVSFVRCAATILIILCHLFQYYGLELAQWFNVGVQMFFFLSGFLYGRKPIPSAADFIAKNFKKVLVPYYCFLIPFLVFYFLFAKDLVTLFSAARILLCNKMIRGAEHLWFVSYILFCYLITPYLSSFAQKFRGLRLGVYLCTWAIALVLGHILFSLFECFYAFGQVVCYLLGFFFARVREEYSLRTFHALAGIFIAAAILTNGARIHLRYIVGTLPSVFFSQYAHALLGAALVLILLAAGKRIRGSAVLRWSDRYSYPIYLVHHFFILSPFAFLSLTQYRSLNLLLTLAAIACCALLLAFVANRVSGGLSKLTAIVSSLARKKQV